MENQDLTQRVLSYIDRQENVPPELEVVRLVAMTGLRARTLLGLRKADVDFDKAQLTCIHKGMKADLITTNEVLDHLRAIDTEGPFYFARKGQPVAFSEVKEHWEALCIAENLRGSGTALPKIAELRKAAVHKREQRARPYSG